MGHKQQRPCKGLHGFLDDFFHGNVQVVGGFVQNQHVAMLQHHHREADLCTLAAGEYAHRLEHVFPCQAYLPQQIPHFQICP